MSKWHLIQPLQREIYQTPTLIVLSEAKLFRQVSCSTEFVRIMCLVCQHFDFNSADWFSDNLHASSRWFCKQWERNLATQFSRCSWGRMVCYTAVFSVDTLRSSSFVGRSVASGQERLTNPWERLRGRLWVRRTHWSGLCITVARKGHYNIFFLLKLSRDNFNLWHDNFELSCDN